MRWGARAIIGGFVVVATLTAAAGSACACSCAEVTDEEALRSSTAVFVGTLRELRRPTVMLSSMDPSRFVFEVESVYKGDVHEVQSVVSASDGGSCGLELREGQRALVFATGSTSDFSVDDGEYTASLCGGTRSFGAVGFPDGLGKGAPPLPGSSPIGESDSIPSEVVRNWYWIAGATVLLVGGGIVLRRRRRHARPPMGE